MLPAILSEISALLVVPVAWRKQIGLLQQSFKEALVALSCVGDGNQYAEMVQKFHI